MLYQLPNGKVVEMSVEQFLELTDEDFQFLMCLDAGDVVEDPFFGTAMGSNIPMTMIKEIAEQDMIDEIEEIDDSIDFSEED
jgi:hypothetical protein